VTNPEQAVAMRQSGMRLKDIADRFGVSVSTAVRWTDAGAAERSRRAAREWKRRNAGTCTECGGPTNSSNGKGTAADVCQHCLTWTPEEALAALRRFHDVHRRSPRTVDADRSDRALPTDHSIAKLFGSWNQGLLAAGLPVNMDRDPATTEAMAAAVTSGLTYDQVGARFGCTGQNVEHRLKHAGIRLQDLRPPLRSGFALTAAPDPHGVRAARLRAGLSQVQLGWAAGVSQSTVSLIEHGNYGMCTDRMVARLLAALTPSTERQAA